MSTLPDRYTAGMNLAPEYYRNQTDIGDWCISGPGDFLGPHGYAAMSKYQFNTLEEAEIVAQLMNVAFAQGIREQARITREVIGL